MSGEITQDELKERVLIALYTYAQSGDDHLIPEHVGSLVEGNFGVQRVKLALQALEREGFLSSYGVMGVGQKYAISEKGYLEIESTLLKKANELDHSTETDPIDDIERQLAPAAGRMVTFGDNQAAQDQAISCVDQALETVRASNTLSEIEKNETAASLNGWKALIETVHSFAVGAFRYLVWDRLKAVIESTLEDTYRAVLTGILISLGAIVVSLL